MEAMDMDVEEKSQSQSQSQSPSQSQSQSNPNLLKRFGLKNSIQTNFGDDYIFQIVPK